MWTFEHSLETKATADAIFALFKDVGRWPEWNAGVEGILLEGPFAAGTSGTMLMPGQDAVKFRLIWAEAGRGFEDETPIPDSGVTVRVKHVLDPLPAGGTRITYRAVIEGPSADEVGPILGPAITADFPEVMAALAARADAAMSRG